MLYKANPSDGTPAPLEGQPHPEDTAHAVEAIRDLICREEGLEPATREPQIPAQAEPREPTRRRGLIRRRAPKPAASVARKQPAKSDKQPVKADKQRVSFQPDWRISLAILLIATFIWNPWFLPTLALLIIATGAIVNFTLGPDRVNELAGRWYLKLQRRNPQRAARLRARANRTSALLERWAGYLPSRWTEGLYFPTFDAVPENDATGNDPFARLVPQERI